MGRDRNLYRITDEIEARCHTAALMGYIRAPRTWPVWQAEITRIEGPKRIAKGDSVTGDARLAGFQVQGRSDALSASDDLFVEDVIVGVRMRVSYRLEELSRGRTTLRRTLEVELPGGPSGRVLSLILRARLRRMQKRLLRELVAQAEAAEA